MKNILNFWNSEDDIFGWPFFTPLFTWPELNEKSISNSPKVNVKETNEAYTIEIANPGITKDQIEITIENNVINVSMISESKEEDGKYHVKQWSKSSYQESWNIPDNVNQDEITSKNVDGVLSITLPKKKDIKQNTSKKIDIK